MIFLKSLPPQARGLSLGLLAVLSICLVLNLGAFVFHLRILTRGTRKHTYLEGDRPHALQLRLRTLQAHFHDDDEHYEIDGAAAKFEWRSIRPPGRGFVFLGEERLPFGVSMWHQIHCLDHIRGVLVNGDDGSDHTAHCFHYLRQAILCAADTTLEPGGRAMKLPNGDIVAPDHGDVHMCRDWRQVYDWMADQYKLWTPDMFERFNETS
ncbi:hypothetical protein CMQ_5611 [Grosmannia clavigera kw1407]|uniref:Oxidase ustYa n=1 Tax=Grosmannia clavigera (strain kw1407 / UAMH 11150) TaxID=655863 RepID=F0XSV6_GROCL|nr:uncharacterized protein CMQ_5611 [Grosmannia clavigera kw1407]EFW99190.1 hypothetical protein CMQ_5611 [Grosmannia clavigera kw1407]